MEKEKAKKLCANCGTELVGKFCHPEIFYRHFALAAGTVFVSVCGVFGDVLYGLKLLMLAPILSTKSFANANYF